MLSHIKWVECSVVQNVGPLLFFFDLLESSACYFVVLHLSEAGTYYTLRLLSKNFCSSVYLVKEQMDLLLTFQSVSIVRLFLNLDLYTCASFGLVLNCFLSLAFPPFSVLLAWSCQERVEWQSWNRQLLGAVTQSRPFTTIKCQRSPSASVPQGGVKWLVSPSALVRRTGCLGGMCWTCRKRCKGTTCLTCHSGLAIGAMEATQFHFLCFQVSSLVYMLVSVVDFMYIQLAQFSQWLFCSCYLFSRDVFIYYIIYWGTDSFDL